MKKTPIFFNYFLIVLFLFSNQLISLSQTIKDETLAVQDQSVSQSNKDPQEKSVPQEQTAVKNTLEEKLNQIVDLDYQGADILGVIRSLAWAYKINIVTGAEVKGKVTLSLKEVPLKSALDAILSTNNLISSIRGDVLYISKGDSDALDVDNEVIYLKYIPAAQAQAVLAKVISSKGDIKLNESANCLIITDFPINILKAKKLIARIDTAPRQVIIEAKIVDVTLSNLDALGIQWSASYDPGKGLFDRSTLYPEKIASTVSLPEQSTDLSGEQIKITSLNFKGLSISSTLDALIKKGKASILASPSIAVVNGQEARIVIGERYPYKERTQTPTGTTETVKFVDIGVTLRATPHINDDGYITIALHPEVSSLQEQLDAGPRIVTREADTTVRIKEGETLIIGGLIKHSEDISAEKVPFLGDIPVIKYMFKRSANKHEQKELAVFITPRIIYSKEEKSRLEIKNSLNENIAENNYVENTYDTAMVLDKGIGLEPKNNQQALRMQKIRALDFYNEIYSKYPDNKLRSAESLYRAGMIYYKNLNDTEKAARIFEQLIQTYPKSDFAELARKEYDKIKFAQGFKGPRTISLGDIQFLNNSK